MGEDPQEEFPGAGGVGARGERGAQAPLVLGEYALDLPALAVAAAGESMEEATAISALGSLSCEAPRIDRDSRERDAEVVATEAVVVLAVEGGVGEDAGQLDAPHGPSHNRRQLRRVVGRSPGDRGRGDEVSRIVAADRQLGPAASPMGTSAASPDEVGADVAGLEARGVHGAVGGSIDQAACAGSGEDDIQETIERPPFRSRCSA